MKILNVEDIKGMEFPAGRLTRVMVGPSAPIEATGFVMGHVTIYPGGSVPIHEHEQEEVYYIAAGHGQATVGDQSFQVRQGDYFYIEPHLEHMLLNTSSENMIMMFCYAPKVVAAHWAEEMQGKEK